MNYGALTDGMLRRRAYEPPPFAWLPHLFGFLRRRLFQIGICFALGMLLGLAYQLGATPRFTATAKVLIDPRAPDIFKQAPVTVSDAESESAVVDSQLEILQSEGVARAVVSQRDLLRNTAFISPPTGLIGQVRAALDALLAHLQAASGPQPPEVQRMAAAIRLMAMQKVRRIGLSNVLEVSVKSASPKLSAELANATVDAFIGNELQARADGSRRASAWMEDHLAQLHRQAVAADSAVQDFRQKRGLLNTDKGQLDQQRLGELSTALAAAHARTAEARGRLAGIRLVLAKGFDGATTESLGNLVIVKLRQQYFEDKSRVAEWTARYGAGHEAVLALRRDMARLQGDMNSELDRIAQSYASELQVAVSSEAAEQANYDAAASRSAATNSDQVTLRALQSNADTYGALYQNFLQRDTLAGQDQSFPISQARMVSAASEPLKKSAPLAPLVLGIGGVLGLGAGLLLAFMRETLDRGLHTAAQSRLATGLDCIGVLPIIAAPPRRLALAALGAAAAASARQMRFADPLLRHVAESPFSAFAEALRGVHMALARQAPVGRGIVIGCVSVVEGEGKSTLACNLALLNAGQGRRVILLDWDLRKRCLTRALAAAARHGLADVATGTAALGEAIYQDAASGLDFLPAGGVTDTDRHASDVLGLAGTARLVSALRAEYDVILIDLPPLDAVADANSVGHLMDTLLMVAAWNSTDADRVRDALDRLRASGANVLGLVLNKVDPRKLRRYAYVAVET